MHPDFLRIGPLDIHTYGVMVALGFALGLWVAGWRAAREGLPREKIADLGVWLIIAGMLGGKVFHIIFFWNDFLMGWRLEGLRSLREGFVFLGGFLAATITAIVYARRHGLPLAKLLDVLAPSLALGHALGRLGCFFNGCCYGKPCDLPWAVTFPPPHQMAGIPLQPTQLYESAGDLVIFAGLSWYFRHRRFPGEIVWLYIFSYGSLRFGLEFLRGDYPYRYLGVFSASHLIAAGMMVCGAAALIRGGRSLRPSPIHNNLSVPR